jgi:hypothetical protein
MDQLRAIMPNPGAYVRESNYFERDGSKRTGGATTLASLKSKENTIRNWLFVVHQWSWLGAVERKRLH